MINSRYSQLSEMLSSKEPDIVCGVPGGIRLPRCEFTQTPFFGELLEYIFNENLSSAS